MPILEYKSTSGRRGFRVIASRMVSGIEARKSKVCYGSRREAGQIYRELLNQIDVVLQAGRKEIRPDLTLSGIFDAWIEHARIVKRSWKADYYRGGIILNYFGRDRKINSITPAAITEFFAWRRKQKSYRGTLISPAEADKCVQLLRCVYNFAIQNQLYNSFNPANLVKLANIPNKREVLITDDEFTAILKAAPSHLKPILLFARYTGLRRGHLLELDYSQIRDGLIHPPEFKPQDALYASPKAHGLVPLPKPLASLLDARKRRGLLFIYKGRTQRDVRTATEKTCKDSGVHFWWGDLRRAYATHLRTLGVDYETRCIILGHSLSGQSRVHDRYQVVTTEEVLAAGKLISGSQSLKKYCKLCTP